MRTYYRSCNRKKSEASCNCAVAIKSGDDVIIFDRCGPTKSEREDRSLDIKVILNGQLTPGTKILRFGGGKKYEV